MLDAPTIREGLEKILASSLFANSPRMSRFLRFVVEETLAGNEGTIKESVIAVEVFGKSCDFDPHTDSTVRTEAGKLRAKLERYYQAAGQKDAVIISIPRGSYVPRFESRLNEMQAAGAEEAPLIDSVVSRSDLRVHAHGPTHWRVWVIAVTGLTLGLILALKFSRESSPAQTQQVAAAAPVSSIASQELQLGRGLRAQGSIEDCTRAIGHFRRATALAPQSAEAHAELAYSFVSLAESQGTARSELMDEAIDEAEAAIKLDAGNALAHRTLGLARLLGGWDWHGAEHEMRRAVELNPSATYARTDYARYCLVPHGRFAEAVKEYETALAPEPSAVGPNVQLASLDIKAGRTEQAIRRLRRMIELHPGSPGALVHLGVAESLAGRGDHAINLFRESLRVRPGFIWAYGQLGFLHGKLRRRSEAESVISQLRSRSKEQAVEYELAGVFAGLGERRLAFDELESAFSRRSVSLVWLKVDHRFAHLHGEARFATLLKRMGME